MDHGMAMALACDGGMGLGPNRGFVPAPGLGPDYLSTRQRANLAAVSGGRPTHTC